MACNLPGIQSHDSKTQPQHFRGSQPPLQQAPVNKALASSSLVTSVLDLKLSWRSLYPRHRMRASIQTETFDKQYNNIRPDGTEIYVINYNYGDDKINYVSLYVSVENARLSFISM